MAIAAPVDSVELSERHQPSGLNSHFTYSGNSFSDYRQYIRTMMIEAHVDRDKPKPASPGKNTRTQRDDIIAANLPFELLPATGCPGTNEDQRYNKGILLLHGLSDSPYWIRHLAEFFQHQCYYVVSILLPGNGTRPGDLLEVEWLDWVKATSFGIDLVKARAKQLWLGGFSTGATLALQQTQQRDDIAGLIMISPALKLAPLAAFADWRQWFGGFYQPALWWQIQPDDDPYKYESFPVNAISELYKLIDSIQDTLQQPPSIPVFIAASEDDASVDSRATVDIFKRWPQSHKKLVWFSREMQPQDGLLQIIDSRHPEHHIRSSSHISLMMPPNDFYYGQQGRYAACAHYLEELPAAWQQCKAKQEDLMAETTPYFLSQGVVRRVSYNPDFAGMLQALSDFINDRSQQH